MEWSTCLSDVFLLTCRASQLVYTAFLVFILLVVYCTDRSFPILLLVMNVVLTSVFLKSLVINIVSFPMYVNFAHFKLWSSCFCFCFPFVPVTLFRTEVPYLLLCNICFSVSVSLFVFFPLVVEVVSFYYNLVCSMKESPEAVGMASGKQVSLEIWKRDTFHLYLCLEFDGAVLHVVT